MLTRRTFLRRTVVALVVAPLVPSLVAPTAPKLGISIRYIKHYEILTDRAPPRMDITCYGQPTLYVGAEVWPRRRA